MENVTSPTTELTFTAPSLPDGVFVDNIIVTVTAINRFGYGMPSNPVEFEISKLMYLYGNCYYVSTYTCIHIRTYRCQELL